MVLSDPPQALLKEGKNDDDTAELCAIPIAMLDRSDYVKPCDPAAIVRELRALLNGQRTERADINVGP